MYIIKVGKAERLYFLRLNDMQFLRNGGAMNMKEKKDMFNGNTKIISRPISPTWSGPEPWRVCIDFQNFSARPGEFKISRRNPSRLSRMMSDAQIWSPSESSSRRDASEMLLGSLFMTIYRWTVRSLMNWRHESSCHPTILVSAVPLAIVPRLLLLATANVVFQCSKRFTVLKW